MADDSPDTDRLPDPDHCEAPAVVIFDGHCRFCRAQVTRLARWDRRSRLAFLPLQDKRVAQRYPDLTYEQLMDQMHLVLPDGRRFAGAAAARKISLLVPRLWPLAAVLHLPFTLPLWSGLYRLVARWRYRLGGRQACDPDGSCHIHFGK